MSNVIGLPSITFEEDGANKVFAANRWNADGASDRKANIEFDPFGHKFVLPVVVDFVVMEVDRLWLARRQGQRHEAILAFDVGGEVDVVHAKTLVKVTERGDRARQRPRRPKRTTGVEHWRRRSSSSR